MYAIRSYYDTFRSGTGNERFRRNGALKGREPESEPSRFPLVPQNQIQL